MGDKTQLLAMLLAVKFRRPWPIVAGILAATLVNHATAGLVGSWLAHRLGPEGLRWTIGVSFIAMAGWLLVPDRVDPEAAKKAPRFGAFGTTLVTFFVAEMGDKTQLATVALAARYPDLLSVVAGTTLGMLIADVPAVFIGDRAARRLPLRALRVAAAAVFLLLGVATLLQGDRLLG